MLLFVVLAWLSAAGPATAIIANSTTHNTTEAPTTTTTAKEILKASETGDPTKVEIVKQIRRLNEDGSYTVGYEADDGTFKIESRDVLGNVKGTFGYIDRDGEIKRVTYSSSGDSTPVPVTTTTTPSPPAMIVRMNKTVSSTTRRPLPTVVYPTRASHTTRGTVIQAIPRRRSGARAPTLSETTTERLKPEDTTTNILSLYKSKSDDSAKMRTQVLKPMPSPVNDDLVTKQTTTKLPVTLKPVYENGEQRTQSDIGKTNTFRRELTGTSSNPRMVSLQQSNGDDSTDVYGSHLSLGTVRPLFTTTTPRPRLVPIHSLVAARHRIQQQYQDTNDEEETTVEASTGRVFEPENVVTSNPVPVVHIPAPRDDDRYYHDQPIYHRPPAAAQFRTREYLRDNPGAPVPIGNQRALFPFDYQNKVLEQQFIKEPPPPPQPKAMETESSTPYDDRQVTRIIPVPVDERGIPLHGYQGRLVNPYRQPQPVVYQPRSLYDPLEEMFQISAPVSTRDLKRLLQILILRQNRLQGLMDQMMSVPYQQPYREEFRFPARQYHDQYDYRYDPRDGYSNQMQNYENPPYESQRYVPRRRFYPRPYDTAGASSNRIEESPEFLPPDVREALLLKMLILAINPEYQPTSAPPTELTTATPPRKQVRNVQILGEEGSADEAKRNKQRQ